MQIETPVFAEGLYRKPCEIFPEIAVGSVRCTACKHCFSTKTENAYYLPILKEATPIVSEVVCKRPITQLSIF